jgi:hypothetical protein
VQAIDLLEYKILKDDNFQLNNKKSEAKIDGLLGTSIKNRAIDIQSSN